MTPGTCTITAQNNKQVGKSYLFFFKNRKKNQIC